MSSKFFSSIIDDEKVVFGVKKETLKSAAKNVAKSYSRNALNKGATYLDYNNPSNRCAYLYKYGAIHTALVTKYFRKLVKVKQVKSLIQQKQDLKIVCLGGGPGTDVIGVFKALSVFPHFHKKITKVTILDICGGWRNSFKRIMENLCLGEIKDVPATFIDNANFKAELISVDLLESLPNNVIERLSNADIVCMVKFVSAILGKPNSVKALQVIGENLKLNSAVLFIGSFEDYISQPVKEVSDQAGLQLVMGPLDETFPVSKEDRRRFFTSKELIEIFGCTPLSTTKVSVMGFIKNCKSNYVDLTTSRSSICLVSKSELEDNFSSYTYKSEFHEVVNSSPDKPSDFCQKFPEAETRHIDTESIVCNTDDLNSLLTTIKKFLDILTEWKEYTCETHCCRCSH